MKYCNYLNEQARQLIEDEISKTGKAKIYYSIDHVSSSGMTRYITMRLLTKNTLIVLTRERKIVGCGMDMVFALLESIMGGCDKVNHNIDYTAF